MLNRTSPPGSEASGISSGEASCSPGWTFVSALVHCGERNAEAMRVPKARKRVCMNAFPAAFFLPAGQPEVESGLGQREVSALRHETVAAPGGLSIERLWYPNRATTSGPRCSRRDQLGSPTDCG